MEWTRVDTSGRIGGQEKRYTVGVEGGLVHHVCVKCVVCCDTMLLLVVLIVCGSVDLKGKR